MGKACDCIPAELGYYFATDRKTGHRYLVQIGRDGNGHVRVFVYRHNRGYDACEFYKFSRRITDPGPLGAKKKGKRHVSS